MTSVIISLTKNHTKQIVTYNRNKFVTSDFKVGQIIKRKSENHCHFYRHNFVVIFVHVAVCYQKTFICSKFIRKEISVDQILFIITDKTNIFDESNISKLTMGLHSFPLSSSVQHLQYYILHTMGVSIFESNRIIRKKGAKHTRNTTTRGKMESINKITTFHY